MTVPEPFLEALRAGDELQARKHARAMLDAGASHAEVLIDLIGAAQREVGDRWLRNEWTIADEHIASSVADDVRAVIMADATWVDNHQLALVACAEGETHGLPARLVADALRLDGYRLVFVGPSLPSDVLRTIVHDREPDLIVLSCTFAGNYVGLARSVSAVSDSRAPLVIGGAAIKDERTARWFGADAWAPSGPALVARLGRAPLPPSTRVGASQVLPTEPFIIDSRLGDLTMVALPALLQRSPNSRNFDGWTMARTRAYLQELITVAGAAVFVNDPSVFEDYVRSSIVALAARNEPVSVLEHGLEQLAGQCDRDLPETAAVMRAGVAICARR